MHKTVREIVYDFTAKPNTEQAHIMQEFGFEPNWDKPFADQRQEFFGHIREQGQTNVFIDYLRTVLS